MENLDTPRTRDPAEAFDDMRAELSLLVRAIQGLTAEREKTPDYSETLGQMDGRLRKIAGNILWIAEQPAMKLTPETMSAQIVEAAKGAREADRAAIRQSLDLHRETHSGLQAAIGSVRTKEQQRWQLLYCCVGTTLAVSLLWLIYPGWAASVGPRRWLWPEATARRTLGEASLWDAGIRLMRAASPEKWEVIVAATELSHSNRDSINACKQAAAKVKGTVKCSIKVDFGRIRSLGE